MSNDITRVAEESARGGFYLTIGKISSTIISALSVIIIARILGSELYGLYTVSTVFPQLLLLLINPGIDQGIMKYAASLRVKGEEKRISKLVIHGLLVKIALGTLATIICFTLSDLFAKNMLRRPEITFYIQIASLTILLQAIFATINSSFIGTDKTEYNTISTNIQALTKAAISTSLVILGLGITGALTGYILSLLAACLFGIFTFLYKIHRPLNRNGDCKDSVLQSLRLLVKYGFPLYLSALIFGLISQYQNILLAIFASNEDIGNFRAAINFTTLISTFSAPIATTLLPAFSKLEIKMEDAKRFFHLSLKYTSIIILPIVTFISLYSKEITSLIYGETYTNAPYFLSLITIRYYLIGLGSLVFPSFFQGLGETKISLKIAIVYSTIFAASAPLLTWQLGTSGLIMVILISSLVSTIYRLRIAKSKFNIRIPIGSISRIYLSSLIPSIPIFVLKSLLPLSGLINVLLGGFTYLAIFAILIPLTKAITLDELNQVKRAFYKTRSLKILTKPIFYCEEKILSYI